MHLESATNDQVDSRDIEEEAYIDKEKQQAKGVGDKAA